MVLFFQVLLRDLAEINVLDGPSQSSQRDIGKHRLVVGINGQRKRIGGFVKEAQSLIAQKVDLPQGYTLQWGGQFENMQRAMKRLMVIIPLTILAIFFLLFMLFKSIRLASLIILVLPFASIGGVFGLLLAGEYLSVPVLLDLLIYGVLLF
jgi:cobalt-zinc-cadmium resistance protein CzcA